MTIGLMDCSAHSYAIGGSIVLDSTSIKLLGMPDVDETDYL